MPADSTIGSEALPSHADDHAAIKHARDTRLPPIGTKLSKRDRHGAVRAECDVEEGGIRYAGTLYKSLSAAASAAAKDLGLKTAVNGFTWWAVVRAKKPSAQPAERLRRIGERYEERLSEFLAAAPTAEFVPSVRAEVAQHSERLQRLLQQLAA